MRSVTVIQGDYATSCDSEVQMNTILGSCVAVCLYDRVAGVGGMNHYLLPGDTRAANGTARYGVHLMELMINALLKNGARRSNFEAKLFGGAHVTVTGSFENIGDRNVRFGRDFLSREGIPIRGESVGGAAARRLRFIPTTGEVRQMLVPIQQAPPVTPAPPKPAAPAPDITLF